MKTEIGFDYVWEGKETVPTREVSAELGWRKIHLLRCKADTEGVQKRGHDSDTTGWFTILAIGPGCRHIKPEHIGARIYLPKVGIGWCYPMGRLNHYGQDFNPERIMKEEWIDTRHGPLMMIIDD